MKRAISAILLLSMLTALPACGGSGSPSDTTAASNDTTTAAPVTTESQTPELPATDMKGRTFTILTQGWASYAPLAITDIVVEEMSGEIMDDTAFKRLSDISDRYNVTIAEVNDPRGQDDGLSKLNQSVMAGDNEYDLAIMRSLHFNSLITSGNLVEMSQLPYFSPEKAYYDTASYEQLAIGGKHYGIVSNVTTNPYLLIFCTYFNKVMAEDYKVGDIYETVRSGKWTLDTLFDISKNVSADINSDGSYTVDDRYGLIYIIDSPEGLLGSIGVNIAETDKSGEILPTYKGETAMTKLQKLFDLLADETVSFNLHARCEQSRINEREVGMFKDGLALFDIAGIYYAPQFRDMKDDYGILPMPKYDESQESYLSPLFSNVFPITVVPQSTANLEETGILLEELSYQGYTKLLPALYDTVLTGKCARDADSVEMLDMIFGNTVYDIGMIYDFGGIRSELRNIFKKLDGSFASTFASLESKVNENIAKLTDAVGELE